MIFDEEADIMQKYKKQKYHGNQLKFKRDYQRQERIHMYTEESVIN